LKLILVRHGETQLNKDGRIQGIGDAPLNATGRAQAEAAARALKRDLPLVLYSSPVARALESSGIISATLKEPLIQIMELAEADAGKLEGLTGQEMRQRFPEFARRWALDSSNTEMPAGESLIQVQKRAWRAIEDLVEKHPDDTVVAVTHNFVIQTIVCAALEIPIRNSRRLRQNLGGITRMDFSSDQSSMVSLNETWHLPAEEPSDG